MKRKWWIPILPLAFLVLVVIVIWPLAPLWQKLGLTTYCLKVEGSRRRFVPCDQAGPTAVPPALLPTAGPEGPTPLIFDDDGSPDGIIALLYFLRNPLYDVRLVTISYGEAHPQVFAGYIARVLAAYGHGDIPVGYGEDAPLAGANAFPDSWRQVSDEFWGLPLPRGGSPVEPLPAARLIVDVIGASSSPVDIFLSGSHTNLASALRLDPSIAGSIGEVFSMGGAVGIPGNIHSDWPEFPNETAEWNLWVDPQAASETFAAGLRLHLVPLDATRQVTWTSVDVPAWQAGDAPESDLAAGLLQWMLDSWSPGGVYIWDLAAAVLATDPSLCPAEMMPLEVVTIPGPDEGRTRVAEGAPETAVCLQPDAEGIKALAAGVFQQPWSR